MKSAFIREILKLDISQLWLIVAVYAPVLNLAAPHAHHVFRVHRTIIGIIQDCRPMYFLCRRAVQKNVNSCLTLLAEASPKHCHGCVLLESSQR